MTTPRVRFPKRLPAIRLFSVVARVRPDERRQVAGAFLTLLGFMAGHALLETARDALFLSSWPARSLPWLYLAIALVALTLTRRPPRVLERVRTQHELSAWLVFAAAVTAGFWALAITQGRWVASAVYIWSGVLATLLVVRFWTALGNLFALTQAKRLFAVIGSGSVAGAILGSAAARLLSAALPARHLVLASAIVFLVSALAPTLLTTPTAARPAVARDQWALPDVARLIWDRPYLRRVALLILLAAVTFTLVDYVFKSVVDRHVPVGELGEFFASVYLTLNLLSLVVQIGFTGWIVRRLGVNSVQALVPALLLLGATGYAALGGLALALVLKGVDGSLRYSLYRTGTELLFVPMSEEVRGRAKAVIDVLGQRGGQALGSLALLAILAVSRTELPVALLAVATATAWILVAVGLRRHYLDVFRETLREDLSETRIAFPALDVASLETLLATLNDRDDRKVVAALDLLAEQGKIRVVPALVLYHPSARVVLRALELFLRGGRDDFLPIADRLVTHDDPRVAAAALRTLSVRSPREDVLRRGLDHPAAEVAVTAAVGLAAGGWLDDAAVRARLEPVVETGPAGTRLALLEALRAQPIATLADLAIRLVDAPDRRVRIEAVRAMRDLRSPASLAPLVAALARRELRGEARAALVAMGPIALARLEDALEDPGQPAGVRRHVPHAIAAFGTVEAGELLARHLIGGADGLVRFQVLRALGRLRSQHPGIPIDPVVLHRAMEQTLALGFDFRRWRQALEDGARREPARTTVVHTLLVGLLRHKQGHSLERVFRLLNLLLNDEEYARIHHGLRSPRPASRAGSRELLEHLAPATVRDPVLALVDDLEDGGPARPGPRVDDPEAFATTLRQLIESPIESVSCLAAAHAGELGLRSLADVLARRESTSPQHRAVVERARHALTVERSSGA